MYDIDHASTRRLTATLTTLLAQRDVQADVEWHDDLLPHWRDDNLLLSQTCGYPLAELLPEVQLVGAFHSVAPGCKDLRYRSWLVVRGEEAHRTLADFYDRRAVCNSADSHSGYNALRYVIAPLGAAATLCAAGAGRAGDNRRNAAVRCPAANHLAQNRCAADGETAQRPV